MPDDQHVGGEHAVSYLELAKLYLQQFGLLTFGTVTTLLMQHVIVTPQLERFQAEKEQTQKIITELTNSVDDLKEENRHARQTAELFDRALIRIEKREP